MHAKLRKKQYSKAKNQEKSQKLIIFYKKNNILHLFLRNLDFFVNFAGKVQYNTLLGMKIKEVMKLQRKSLISININRYRRLVEMKKESKVNQAKYVELNLFPEEKEDHQKDSISSENMESDTSPDKEYDLTDLFERLSQSAFRSRFHLSKKDKEYIAEKGLATIRKHAEDFVAKRLAPAVIPNDGKQTPMRGHPVYIAQHATGCCCRGCFFKWHHIPAGRQLTEEEQQYAVAVLMTWIEKQV